MAEWLGFGGGGNDIGAGASGGTPPLATGDIGTVPSQQPSGSWGGNILTGIIDKISSGPSFSQGDTAAGGMTERAVPTFGGGMAPLGGEKTFDWNLFFKEAAKRLQNNNSLPLSPPPIALTAPSFGGGGPLVAPPALQRTQAVPPGLTALMARRTR